MFQKWDQNRVQKWGQDRFFIVLLCYGGHNWVPFVEPFLAPFFGLKFDLGTVFFEENKPKNINNWRFICSSSG